MLEIRNVRKAFGSLEVLKGVDLRVEQGDVAAILGPSGSGKTTLLRCINFLETAGGGTMTFDGEDFRLDRTPKKDIARLRKKTAFVFQDYNLFRNKTALQNVAEGLITARGMPKDQALEISRRALEKVGMAGREDHYPHQLSGGLLRRAHLRPGPGADGGGAVRHAAAGGGGYDHAGGHPRNGLRPDGIQQGDFHGGRRGGGGGPLRRVLPESPGGADQGVPADHPRRRAGGITQIISHKKEQIIT